MCLHVYAEDTNRGPVCGIHERLDIGASLLNRFTLSLFTLVYIHLVFVGVCYAYVGKIANLASFVIFSDFWQTADRVVCIC